MIIRKATPDDAEYLAQACLEVVRFMRKGDTDKFISGFPDEVAPEMIKWARDHAASSDKVAFIAEEPEGNRIGCIFGRIEESNMPMAISGEIGSIPVCWVEPDHQNTGIGRALLGEIEKWFLARGIHHLEVAYMARNAVAREAWTHFGFVPFRIFAYKEIGE
ncbi:MAG: GNAT family N-acetyltransferase [Gammaproteobacteria bacterium]